MLLVLQALPALQALPVLVKSVLPDLTAPQKAPPVLLALSAPPVPLEALPASLALPVQTVPLALLVRTV